MMRATFERERETERQRELIDYSDCVQDIEKNNPRKSRLKPTGG